MTPLTVTLGTIGIVLSIFCWVMFFRGIFRLVRSIAIGEKVDNKRFWPVIPRFMHMMKEFLIHTRMVKFPLVGVMHWLVMIGFLGGFLLFFEAYGQSINPEFHWPLFGDTFAWHLWDELLGIGTVVGIVTLIIIRQLNHPRVPARLSRFSGSRFIPAYTIEAIVLIEGLGMIFVKAGKIATYHHSNAGSDFFTMQVAKLLPASPNMVGIFALIKLLSGSLFLFLVGTHLNWGVAWHRFSAFFNIYLKREQDGSVALGALSPMLSNGKVLTMDNADPDVDSFGAGKIQDFSWKGWLDFTTCTECGRCQSQCPAWNTGKPLSPKLLIMSLRDNAQGSAPYLLAGGRTDMAGDETGLVDADGNVLEDKLNAIPEEARAQASRRLVGESAGSGSLPDGDLGAVIDTETLWSCTTCGACVEQCPVDIEHIDHIVDMRRYQVLIESDFPSELAGLFKNLENKGNPWGQASAARSSWIDEMDIEIPVYGQDVDSFEGFEYLFWVGCAGAFEDRAKKTTKAVAELLDVAAVNFLVLGQGETCTGDSARRAGNEFLFQMLAQQNIETFDDLFGTAPRQPKKIVVTCAHCFNTINNEYPQVGGDRGTFEVVHHTQLLNKLVREKRLVPVAPVGGESVTYHDPCYLGRHNHIYEAPRDLMKAAGSQVTEMPRHGTRSMCCGAGGARMWMEEQLGKRINIDRVDEALDTLGVDTATKGSEADAPTKVATGCPFCRVMLTDGVTARTSGTEAEDTVQVVDVAQLLLDSVRRGSPEVKRGGRFLGPASVAAAAAASAPAEEKADEKAAPEAAAPAAAAAGGVTPKPKVGLGMKGGKKPGGAAKAEAPATDTAAAPATPPAEKKPAAKGFGMAAGKKPGAAAGSTAAAATPAAEAPAAAAETTEPKPAKAKGFGMAAGKKPGAKAPGAGTQPAAATPAAEPETASAAPAAEAGSVSATTEATPAKAKGFGMAAGKKRPGAAASAPAAAPAATPAPAEEAPAGEAPADTPAPDATPAAAPEETAGTGAPATTEAKPAKAKGFGMAAGKARPGAAPNITRREPAAAPEEAAPEAPAPAEPEASAPEPTPSEPAAADDAAPEVPAPDAGATGNTGAVTEAGTSKAKGFGIAAGKKRPGGN